MNEDVLPMFPVLKRGVGFRRLFDEGVALVAETSKVNVLNDTGSRFLELANGSRTTAQILSLLADEYDAPPESIRREVVAFLDQAIGAGLVELRPVAAG